VPRGFEILESGRGFYLTHMKGEEESADGRPVKLPVTFRVPRDNWLEVDRKRENGSSTSGYSFTVSKDEITFYKAEGPVGGLKRVKAFSKKLTGEK
jgi:hypothetical protein